MDQLQLIGKQTINLATVAEWMHKQPPNSKFHAHSSSHWATLLTMQPQHQCVRVSVCVCECAHCQWFLLSLVLFRVAFFLLFSYMYFCQTVTIFGYTSWAPLMPVFARSFAVGNRQLCLSLMMFRRDKGKYFQVMLECVLFFGTSACTSKSHYPYIPYIYTHMYSYL